MNPDMMEALAALAEDRGISVDTLFAALAEALEAAYKKQSDAYEFAWVNIDTETGEMRVFAQELDEDGEPVGPEMDVTPEDFGRIAAQTVRQVMTQRIREAERDLKYEEYAGREGDIVTGIIQQSDSRYTLLDLGRVEALLPQSEQVNFERPEPNERVKAYIIEVRKTAKGPQIVVSRTHPGLVRRLFELEVPEIAEGVVEIKACAREPGPRTKIAVWSNDENIDPVGACVGPRGARVRQVMNELRGEKIDIVPFSEDRQGFVMNALQPARVSEVRIDEEMGNAEVIVPDHQLSLAIGKEGQNARLASRLTGLRIDIRDETSVVEREAYEAEYGGESWADGAWIEGPGGIQMWQPADGSEPLTIEEWEASNVTEDSDSGDPESGDTESGDTESGDTESGDTESGDTESGDTESGDTESTGDANEAGAEPAAEADVDARAGADDSNEAGETSAGAEDTPAEAADIPADTSDEDAPSAAEEAETAAKESTEPAAGEAPDTPSEPDAGASDSTKGSTAE